MAARTYTDLQQHQYLVPNMTTQLRHTSICVEMFAGQNSNFFLVPISTTSREAGP